MISVSRPINGITINGDEFLLDENNKVILFPDIVTALDWLRNNGVSDNEIEEFNFNNEDNNEDNVADRIYAVG